MRLFSYILRYDDGFAPNPFHRCCTLACCKPVIRRVAQPRDWVVGLTSRGEGIAYVMRVSEKLLFAEYWRDPRFKSKRPTWSSDDPVLRFGDNIYEPRGGGFKQHASSHSKADGTEDKKAMEHDFHSEHVLVSRHFVYFGADAPPLPRNLGYLKVGRNHRSRFSEDEVERFVAWADRLRLRGRRGMPALWSSEDRGRGCGRCGSS